MIGTLERDANFKLFSALVEVKEFMGNDPAIIDEMLRTARTIAVVGLSDKTWRASHHIGRYLAANGYRVIPVNPGLSEVIGLKCYPDLDSAQAAARKAAARVSTSWMSFGLRRMCRRLLTV